MQKKLNLAVLAMCCVPAAYAQTDSIGYHSEASNEAAFTFTEAQLGEDDDMTQNVTIVNSNTNIYASQVGYLFSPARFRYRAFDQKYNEVFVNGLSLNDMESGQFRYSQVGGLNNMTRNVDYSLPFENNSFAFSGMAGSNNYNFRAAAMPVGQRLTLSGANRNYTLRGMYTYSTGLSEKGWAFTGALSYRWASNGYVEGTFYNSLSYFLGVQKVFGNHSLSFSTWGNPTERSTQGAGTDEVYWLANNRYYNPYWGYQNGKKRNSRVVTDYAPSAILTWDWTIDNDTKLTTSLFGKYSMYKSTKLNYNNSDNPQPNYWKNLPSSYYDVWYDTNENYRTEQAFDDWTTSYNYWRASKANRQINWDRLYYANRNINAEGVDAMYYVQAKHNDNLTLTLSSTFNHQIDKDKKVNLGIMAGTNKGMHYQTMEDMLGANSFHNINTYIISDKYTADSPEADYDLNNPKAVVKEGDRFGYDYNIFVNKARLWTSYSQNIGRLNYTVAGKIGYTSMQREGRMRNGLAANNSYGKSHHAQFLDGGVKLGSNITLGGGHVVSLGAAYEYRAPEARSAFMAPEVNNDFVAGLKNERVFNGEIGYMYENSWLHLNLNGYYSRMENVSDWQNFFNDDVNSFIYVSLTDMKKEYYGAELGAKFKLASFFDVNLIGTISEAKIVNNAKLTYTAPEWKTETPVYWNNGTYDVYAYAPYSQSINSISDYKFSVALDQTSQGYNESDFLFASAKSQTASAAGVPLQFRHCMSRVCIRLVKGRDYDGDLPDDAKVYIHNTVPQATIDLSAGIATKYMYGREATITARNEGNHKFGAILVPQRIDRRRPLFEVVMNGVAYLVEDNFVFRMGMCHTISLVISKAPEQVKIEIGGEIENWNKEQ